MYKNPILRGFHPDPSICAVGDDYYLVTSTFTYFPAVPIYHSKNLVDWTLIGHCLTRQSQLNLINTKNSKGVYAPTIRYNDGIFYMITTDVQGKGNFIVYANDPRGEWSEPILIDQNGIDPSLFWDDDGTCWYTGKGIVGDERGIVAFKLNPLTGEIMSDKYLISKGCGGQHPEGPHILKKDGFYYLIIAEGGTQYGHRVVIQRSKEITKGYEDCPHNPLLYHGEEPLRTIQAVGHCDIFQDQNDKWWAVCLGIRKFGSLYLHNLGRETFLVPVEWKNGWAYMGNNGFVDMEFDEELPGIHNEREEYEKWSFEFNLGIMKNDISYIRHFDKDKYLLEDDSLTLKGTNITLNDEIDAPVCMFKEQIEFVSEIKTCVNFSKSSSKRYGLTAYYSNFNHYDVAIINEDGESYITVYKHIFDLGVEVSRIGVDTNRDSVWIMIKSNEKYYEFYYSYDNLNWVCLDKGSITTLCTEVMMERCFTGTMMGIFAENGDAIFEKGIYIVSHTNSKNFIDEKSAVIAKSNS